MSQSLSLFQTLSELWARGQEPCEPISLSFERALSCEQDVNSLVSHASLPLERVLSCEQEPWEPLLSRVWALSWEIGSQDPGTLYATLPSINECFQFSLKLWLIPFVTPDQMQCGLAYALIGHDKYLVVWSYISLLLPILPRTEHIVLGWLCVPPVFPSMHPLTHFAIQAWGAEKMRCQNIIISSSSLQGGGYYPPRLSEENIRICRTNGHSQVSSENQNQ